MSHPHRTQVVLLLCLVLVFSVLPSSTVLAETVEVSFAAVADARVVESNPSTNSGTIGRLDVDSPGEESYIRFSVSGVSGAVHSATLWLFVTNGSSNGPGVYGTGGREAMTGFQRECGSTWHQPPPGLRPGRRISHIRAYLRGASANTTPGSVIASCVR